MVNRIFCRKVGMTRYFLDEGACVPVTIVKVEPCVVVQKKTIKKDGYEALQVGFQEQKKEDRLNKPRIGHLKGVGGKFFTYLREIRVDDTSGFELGQEIKADIFQIGESVKVSGRSKGRGFAGVVKRWGFSGGKETHGCMSHRVPGSIGTSSPRTGAKPRCSIPASMRSSARGSSRILSGRPATCARDCSVTLGGRRTMSIAMQVG